MSALSPASPWMIYGANGYTGNLAAEKARIEGSRPILAGRNREVIEGLGRKLGLETRVFGLDDPAAVAEGLRGVAVVLHAAGPFSATCRPMLEGCVLSRTHYLDITGEIDVFEYTQQNDAHWKQAGITVIPGVGFDVVPSDCLAAMLARELPGATQLKLAFKSRKGKLSPGTTKTMIEGLAKGGMIRKDGMLTTVPPAYKIETIAFPDGPHLAVTIPWGDVSTAYYSTGIPNIEVYMGATRGQIRQMKIANAFAPILGMEGVQRWLKNQAGRRVKGPTLQERDADEMQLWGEASDGAGNKATLSMKTPEGYTLTVDSSLAAVRRILNGTTPVGALTPSRAFGADFVASLPGVEVIRPGAFRAPSTRPRPGGS